MGTYRTGISSSAACFASTSAGGETGSTFTAYGYAPAPSESLNGCASLALSIPFLCLYLCSGAAFFAASILGAPTFASAVYALGAFASASFVEILPVEAKGTLFVILYRR